jgi:signal transduction histidine kinase
VESGAAPHVVVEDNGIGIPDEERHLVFERFHRVLGTDVAGSGLGLSIVRTIADMHGARVELAAAPGGEGTRFTVSFPSRAQAVRKQ